MTASSGAGSTRAPRIWPRGWVRAERRRWARGCERTYGRSAGARQPRVPPRLRRRRARATRRRRPRVLRERVHAARGRPRQLRDRRISSCTMAKLIYSVIASLDGYVADEDGTFDWAAPDE